ncbi:MAG: TraR/DksA C4-type zinc finger protein [Deltaproteobacteria bacterium]
MEFRRDANSSWQRLHEPESELEETASKDTLSRGLEQLDERGQQELYKIDTALTKMEEGDYGICEECGRRIAVRRLHAVPWAQRCVRCAATHEKGSTGSLDEQAAALDTEELTDDEMREAVYDALQEDGRIEMEELSIWCEEGVLYLEGVLPSAEKHEILNEIVEDLLNFKEVVDNITIDPQPWERAKRTTDSKGGKMDKEIMMEGEDEEVDVYTSLSSGEPMTPPDKLKP